MMPDTAKPRLLYVIEWKCERWGWTARSWNAFPCRVQAENEMRYERRQRPRGEFQFRIQEYVPRSHADGAPRIKFVRACV